VIGNQIDAQVERHARSRSAPRNGPLRGTQPSSPTTWTWLTTFSSILCASSMGDARASRRGTWHRDRSDEARALPSRPLTHPANAVPLDRDGTPSS
jgi:hypothetical protein